MSQGYGLSAETLAQIRAVLGRHPEVDRAVLYGSRAVGNHQPGSDIDLVLQGGHDLTERVLYDILNELDDLPLPYSFDVAIHAEITHEALLDHIRRWGAVLYERPAAR